MKEKDTMTVGQFVAELLDTMEKFADKAEGKIKDLQEKNSALEEELNQYKLTYDGSFERLFQAAEDKLLLQERVKELENILAGLVGNMEGLQEEYVSFIKGSWNRNQVLVEALEKSEVKRRNLEEEKEEVYSAATHTINNLETEIHQLQLEVEKREDAYEVQKKKSSILQEHLKAAEEKIEFLTEAWEAQNKYSKEFLTEVGQQMNTIKRLENENIELKEDKKGLFQMIHSLEDELQDIKDENEKLRGEVNYTLRAWSQDQDTWEKRVTELEEIINTLLDWDQESEQQKLEEFKELLKNYVSKDGAQEARKSMPQ